MASNTNIQVANLDFADIKQNFINYLQSQDTFKGYNFSGSALSTLLDVLAYNTQYNAYYLNMVANEMFLDSALQRSSVVSHAKLMNYVPQSAVGAVALINVSFYGANTSNFTVPKYTNFMSESINGVNYNYVTTDYATVSVANNVAFFPALEIKQGIVVSYNFTADSSSNPQSLFEIPDPNIDTSTMTVTVQQSSSNNSYQVYNPTTDYLSIQPTDTVYFLQEAVNGNYQIYFGDGVIGQQLTDGNIVTVTYISTSGTAGGLANNFVLMDNLGSYTVSVVPYLAATQGQDRETIQSIKFQAPKAFSAQGRAVSKNDYITAIQQNNLGIPFDAVSVWGGEENIPPIYGQVFISLKPKGGYDLTATQKQLIKEQVIKPISVLTVEPVIVDPDYTYLQVYANVVYQQSQTALTPTAMQTGIQNAIYGYSANNLNTFNSSFNSYLFLQSINNFNPSIISSDYSINTQKKFYPIIGGAQTYTLNYNTPLQRGVYGSGISSSPAIQVINPANTQLVLDGVYIEEVPTTTSSVDSISIITTGYNYTQTPTILIQGDGYGANAYATLVNGALSSITVANSGIGYTSAVATVVPAIGDTTGAGAALLVNLAGRYGSLRTYYNSPTAGKVVVNPNAGTIDYTNGILTLNGLNIVGIDNPLGELTVSTKPLTTLISSTYNRIITIDTLDPSAINVTVTPKT
jgi:hypothetical protein